MRAFIPLAVITVFFFFFFFWMEAEVGVSVVQFSLSLNGFTLNNNYVDEAVAVFLFWFQLRAVSGDCVVALCVSFSSPKPVRPIHH